MANNPYVNKVVYGNDTVMDISDTTAEEADVESGKVFYKASGARSVGTGSTGGGVWGTITGTLSDQTDLQDALDEKMSYADNGVLGAKNLLFPKVFTSETINGVTFTKLDDGKININGTNSGSASYFNVNPNYTLSAGNYILSKGFSNDDVRLSVDAYNGSTWVKNLVTLGTAQEHEFTVDYNDYDAIRVQIVVQPNKSVSNVVAYPMIRLASDTDSTYRPYTMTNKELTDKVEDAVISLTKAEYDALPSADKSDPDKVYYVTDYDPSDDSTVVQVPSFYVELSTAPTEQTPIVVPDGTLSKPFRLILRNVGSSNINIGVGSSAVFMKEQTSATVKSIYTTYKVSSYSYYNGSSSVRIYPASTTSQAYPSIVDLTYDPKVEKLIFAYTRTYNEYDFLSVKQKGSEIDSSDAVDIYTSNNESIIIFAREYNASTGVYRGHHAYYVFTPNVESPVPQSVSMGASSNTGISITFANEDTTTGKVTIKASASTYYVDYTTYRICN